MNVLAARYSCEYLSVVDICNAVHGSGQRGAIVHDGLGGYMLPSAESFINDTVWSVA